MKIELPEKIFGIDGHLIPILIPPILLLLLVIGMSNFTIMPKLDEISQVRAKTETVKAETKKITDKRDYIRSLDQEELAKNGVLIASALLPEKNAYFLVNVIRKVTEKYQYIVDSFRISLGEVSGLSETKTTKIEGVAKVPVELKLVGPKVEFLNLVNGLERSLPVLALDSLDLKSQGESVNLTIRVSAYYIEDKAKFTLEKLNLADLILKKEESEVLKTLGDYSVTTEAGDIEGQLTGSKEYIKYDRKDPFSP